VFARLVAALVFKTSGGYEQCSRWIRFPYTPVLSARVKRANLFWRLLTIPLRLSLQFDDYHEEDAVEWPGIGIPPHLVSPCLNRQLSKIDFVIRLLL
jgi:hypothetical protein